MKSIGVLMVCMGNICRSPTAHGVFAKKVFEAGLAMRIRTDSAGTYAGHKGQPADRRAQQHAQLRGYDLSPLRSRPVRREDFTSFDYIVAMDEMNFGDLTKLVEEKYPFDGKLVKLLDFSPDSALHGGDVPDPYYGGASGFDRVLDLVEPACDGLLTHIIANEFSAQR
jgi:protein-tyrosine phosphatase